MSRKKDKRRGDVWRFKDLEMWRVRDLETKKSRDFGT
jgi:hypothetical protein